MPTGKKKIEAIVKKWSDKAFNDSFPLDDAITGAVREAIAECRSIVDSMRGSGDADLRSVRAFVASFERWSEGDDDDESDPT